MNARFLLFSFSFFFISSLFSSVYGQLHLKLQLIDDLTWGVFVKPVGVYPDEFTVTGSGQVTVIMPNGYQWSELQSISGLWVNNKSVISPIEAPNSQYISFGLTASEPSHPIKYQAGIETLLFTFKGNDNCPDFMYLIDCDTPNESDPFCQFSEPNGWRPDNDLSVLCAFGGGICFYYHTDNYAMQAWDCQDNDGDGLGNGMEDTNGNGIYDEGDASDLNTFNPFLPPKLPKLPGHQSLFPSVPVLPDSLHSPQFPEKKLRTVQSNAAHTYLLSPNPVRETLFVEMEQELPDQKANLHLFDLQGNILMQEKMIIDGQIKLDVSALPTGMYFLSIDVGSRVSETKKFVKF